MIEIWSKPACPYCVKAKNLCEQKGYQYTYKMLDEDFTREELFEKFPTARTFPQITTHGEYLGGYTEFEQWVGGLRKV
jgi:glutaredoxin